MCIRDRYVTVPDLTNYVQADAEQQLKSLGVSVLVTQAVDLSLIHISPVCEILRAALAQARYMQVPVSAAVNEAVKLTRKIGRAHV